MKAEYHGCLLTIVKSKCPSYVGLQGIVVQETENAFRIVTKDDKLKTILKSGTVFSFALSSPLIARDYTVTIFGDQFRYRSFDRSARKFKKKEMIDL
jgi:ribonuclease P protein subunit POP4